MSGRGSDIMAFQLELQFPAPAQRGSPRGGRATRAEHARRAEAVLARLRAAGLRRIDHCRLTRNQTVMASWRGTELRLHEAFVEAPAGIIDAIVTFVEGRGAARAHARRVIVDFPIPQSDAPRRREGQHAEDARLVERLVALHRTLNVARFDGTLGAVTLRVSRRMRRRLGHYRPAGAGHEAEIVLSRRHIRRHGWRAATETLLHEMVHQWQDESGRPLGHGTEFRRKACAVGIEGRSVVGPARALP